MLKKLCLIVSFLTILVILNISMVAYAASGICGQNTQGILNSNLTWTLDTETGVLNIMGEGEMYDAYSVSKRPWHQYRDYIKSVIISDGVTSIGTNAFSYCKNLTSVQIPNSITNIERYAFCQCTALEDIMIPKNISSIGTQAFIYCDKLKKIYITDSLSWSNIYFEDNYSNPLCNKGTLYVVDIQVSSRTTYILERDHDLDLTVTYVVNGRKTILDSDDYQLDTNFDPYTEGAYDIKVTYDVAHYTLTDKITVYVAPLSITSISISAKPTYIIGEDTALDIAVKLNYNDGTYERLSPDAYTIETDFDPNTEGNYNIKVTYGDYTAQKTVSVEPLKVTSIQMTNPPDKREFLEGTPLDLTGMVIMAHYNNGTSKEVTDYAVLGYDSSIVGSRYIIIEYEKCRTRTMITVNPKTLIGTKIVSLPNKTYYCNDETNLDLTGLVLEKIYDNGTSEPTTAYSISGFDRKKTGKQVITLRCSGFTSTFEIYVKRYEYKINSPITRNYDFDTKTLTVGVNITNRTEAGAVKIITAVYNSDGALMKTTMKNVFFDANETKDLSVDFSNVEYPFGDIKVFVWDFDFGKMTPMALEL